MSSTQDVCSNFSQHERLRPLDSSSREFQSRSLPPFSEFLSFTFPTYELYRRNVRQEGTIVLSELHPVSRVYVLGKDVPSSRPDCTFDNGSSRTKVLEMKQTALGFENRTSFTEVRPCENSYNPEKKSSRSTRSVSGLHPTQLDNDQSSSLTFKCSNYFEAFRVSETTGKEPVRRRNLLNTTRFYDCPFCPLVLLYQKHLIAHVKEKHEQKKPFGCPRDGCWQRFGGLGDMNRHVKTVHDGEKRFSCDLCARCFSRRSGLKRHAYHVHGGDD